MKCPDCTDKLIQNQFKGVLVESCEKCNGTWFDRDELTKAKNNTDEDIRWLDFDPFNEISNDFKVESESKNCPKCNLKMQSLSYGKSKVVINKCEKCHGVWLHHGEFKKIIDYLETVVTSISSKDYAKDSFKQVVEIMKEAGNVGHEVKDLMLILKLLRLRISAEHPQLTIAANNIYKYLPFL